MGSFGSPPTPPPPPPEPPPYVPPAIPEDDGPGAEEQSAENRRQSLLRRSRGRFGTVLTSFRGLLSPSGSGERKTLLGE